MTRTLSRVQAIVLGIVVLACLGLTAWLFLQIGARQRLWSDTVEFRAGFTQTYGIDKGTPVRVRGVEAGQVVAVELPNENEPDGKVYLRLRVERRFLPLMCADAKARVLNEGVLGGRLINIDPGRDVSRKLVDGDEIAVVEPKELADLLQQAGQTLEEIRESNGTLAKLVKSDEAHKEVVTLIRDTQNLVRNGQETLQQTQETIRKGEDAIATLKQDADAIKRLPIIRSYIEDSTAILVRPDQHSDRRVYATEDLFEPGRAILTDHGKYHLSNLASWFEAMRIKSSDIVVVTYAAPPSQSEPSNAVAQLITRKQSEAVAEYLREHVKAEKISWYSSRKITALGQGANSPPLPEREPLPPARVEIIIFWPR